MKYDHDNESVLQALGFTRDEYRRIINVLEDISAEYNDSPGYTKNSQFIELLEKNAVNEPMLLRYIVFKYVEYLADPLSAMRDSGRSEVIELSPASKLPEDMPEGLKKMVSEMMRSADCGDCEGCEEKEDSIPTAGEPCTIKH